MIVFGRNVILPAPINSSRVSLNPVIFYYSNTRRQIRKQILIYFLYIFATKIIFVTAAI